MISRIDQPPNVPKAPVDPRKTEETDTRQALQRHDPEFYKKKDDDKDRPGFRDPYEDLTDVSVPALKNFLLGLLDKITGPVSAPPPTPAEHARTASSPQAAAAVSAYQTGARRGVMPPPPPVPVFETPASALDQAAAGLERADVLELIRELDRLYAEGVTAIALEKGDGFLASIRAGINRARGI